MESYKYAIAGSGPAGVSAARVLEGAGACVIDIGKEPAPRFGYETLDAALAAHDVEALLGPAWENLANIVVPDAMSPKLRPHDARHVADGEVFEVRGAAGERLFRCCGSHAAGGWSVAWGGQLFRYDDDDLDSVGGWPIKARDLEPWYDELERHIGISGAHDDMDAFFGASSSLLPPAPLAPAAELLLSRYEEKRRKGIDPGIMLGRSRLAVLTRPCGSREAHAFGETDFFTCPQKGLYTARSTLDELKRRGEIAYLGGHELVAWREKDDHVLLTLKNRGDGSFRTIKADHLLLGCGAVQTARLLLINGRDEGRRLPFLDHPPVLVPLLIPSMFGSALPRRSFPVQLTATLKRGVRDMISFYYPAGIFLSELAAGMPLPLDCALKMLRPLVGGLLVAQVWAPSVPSEANHLRLNEKREIEICYPPPPLWPRLGEFLRAMRKLGAFSLKRLASSAPPGDGFHHAAILPMRANPGEYETHADGRLWNSRRVRVIDGSVLPSLPAKNHSLTIMANAARIADEALKCGY